MKMNKCLSCENYYKEGLKHKCKIYTNFCIIGMLQRDKINPDCMKYKKLTNKEKVHIIK